MRRPRSLAALRSPIYRRVWIAGFVSAGGDWMQITARAYLIYALTGSTTDLGLVYVASYLPQALFSLLSGALADRLDRRRLIVAGTVVQGLVALLLAVLTAADAATVWNIAALSFVAGTAMTFTLSPTLAVLPGLVPQEDLASAMSLNSATYSGSRVVGPLAAGALIPLTGVATVFAINAVTFAYAVVVWARADLPVLEEGAAPGPGAIVEGLRHLRRTPTIAVPVAILAAIGVVGFVYQPLAVVYATDVLAAGDQALGGTYFGVMQGLMGVGAVLGALGLTALGERRVAAAVIGGSAGFAVALAGLGSTALVPLALAISVAVAGLHMGTAVLLMTIVQHQTVERLRGRMMAIAMMAWVGSIPFASWLWGVVASRLSVGDTFVVAASCTAVVAVVAVPWRARLRPLGEEPGSVGAWTPNSSRSST